MDYPQHQEERPIKAGFRYQDNPWMVIGLLFFVTGALGVPVIWVSRAFSVPVKLLLTLAVTLYTLLLCGGFWLVMVWAYHRLAAQF